MSNRRWPGNHRGFALSSAERSLLVAIVIAIFTLATGQAASPAWLPEQASLVAGRVLVKFRAAATAAQVAAVVESHGWQVLRHIPGVDLTVVGVPNGREAAAVTQLRAEPLAEYAELDRVVVEAPGGPAYFTAMRGPGEAETQGLSASRPLPISASQSAADGVAVTNLRMATVPGGSAPCENKFSASRSEIYAVFDYDLDVPDTPLRLEVFYQDPALGAVSTFTATQAYTGTGTASVAVSASQAFSNQGSFQPGWYETTVSATPDGGDPWVPLASVTWRAITIPNDEHFDRYQWNLNNCGQAPVNWDVAPGVDINAPEAWDVTTGRHDLVIAFLGSGVELSHPDLQDRIWTNPGEIPGNGRDDDGNGYVDDVRGWDFANNDNDPSDDYGSGTFAAGLAAASTNNNRGIAGVTWGGRIMPVKVLYVFGNPPQVSVGGRIEDVIAGLVYAVDNGARIIHLSFQNSTDDFNVIESMRQAIDYAHQHGALVVAGAGDRALEGNPPVYPAVFENVLSVAATDGQDQRIPSSSTGFWVDVAAPAQIVVSTYQGVYGQAFSGLTLYSAAEAAGLAALVWSVDPTLTADQVKSIIEQSADDLGSPGHDDAFGWGRINAERAVRTTAHRLTLSQTNVIFFEEDDQPTPSCSTVTNPNTSAITWRVSTPETNWLSVTGPTGKTPSSIQICVDSSQVPGDGVYTSTITVTSTLTSHVNSPITLPVHLVLTDQMWRVDLPVVLRDVRFP